MIRTIRAILFDLGDTLWVPADIEIMERLDRAADQQFLSVLHTHVDTAMLPDEVDNKLMLRIRRGMAARRYAYHTANPGIEPDPAQKMQEALYELNFPPLDLKVCAELHEALRTPLSEGRVLFDDVLSTLEELRRRGFLLGVVTNRPFGGPLFLDDMERLGLLEYFPRQAVAISEDLGVLKPHPDIFHFTLNALAVSPEETVMVGDSLPADVVGANRLNMTTVWKPKLRLRADVKAYCAANGLDCDDEVLYTQLSERVDPYAEERDRLYPLVRPDYTIEHIGELLTLFPKAGLQ